MKLFSTSDKFEKNYFSILLAFLPISFIAGNLIINLNLILLILSAFFFYKSEIFNLKYLIIDKLLFLYFFIIIFTGIYNDFEIRILNEEFSSFRGGYYTTLKSFLFLKYLLLYIILRFLIFKNILNLKHFFVVCSIATLFVCFDIFFQFFNGEDIFGFTSPPEGRKLGGPFGDELIAGSYIQRFSLFAFFSIPLFFKNNLNKFSFILVPTLLIVFFTGLILSGNRMPLVLFLFLLSLVIIFQSQTRKFLLPFLTIISIVFFLAFQFNNTVKSNFLNFYSQLSKMGEIVKSNNLNAQNTPQHFKEFQSFYGPWSSNKFIGGGIKNFRFYCHKEEYKINQSGFVCNMHPHNYYLEILTETGLIGFAIISIFFMLTLYYSFFKKYFTVSRLRTNNLITPFIFLFIIEIFPIKSTGSFFTTGN